MRECGTVKSHQSQPNQKRKEGGTTARILLANLCRIQKLKLQRKRVKLPRKRLVVYYGARGLPTKINNNEDDDNSNSCNDILIIYNDDDDDDEIKRAIMIKILVLFHSIN